MEINFFTTNQHEGREEFFTTNQHEPHERGGEGEVQLFEIIRGFMRFVWFVVKNKIYEFYALEQLVSCKKYLTTNLFRKYASI
jgi:hypothetical protein